MALITNKDNFGQKKTPSGDQSRIKIWCENGDPYWENFSIYECNSECVFMDYVITFCTNLINEEIFLTASNNSQYYETMNNDCGAALLYNSYNLYDIGLV